MIPCTIARNALLFCPFGDGVPKVGALNRDSPKALELRNHIGRKITKLNTWPALDRQGEIGPDLYHHACQMGLEGSVSKHKERPYRPGRSSHWIKMKNPEHSAMTRVKDSFQ